MAMTNLQMRQFDEEFAGFLNERLNNGSLSISFLAIVLEKYLAQAKQQELKIIQLEQEESMRGMFDGIKPDINKQTDADVSEECEFPEDVNYDCNDCDRTE